MGDLSLLQCYTWLLLVLSACCWVPTWRMGRRAFSHIFGELPTKRFELPSAILWCSACNSNLGLHRTRFALVQSVHKRAHGRRWLRTCKCFRDHCLHIPLHLHKAIRILGDQSWTTHRRPCRTLVRSCTCLCRRCPWFPFHLLPPFANQGIAIQSCGNR